MNLCRSQVRMKAEGELYRMQHLTIAGGFERAATIVATRNGVKVGCCVPDCTNETDLKVTVNLWVPPTWSVRVEWRNPGEATMGVAIISREEFSRAVYRDGGAMEVKAEAVR